MTSTPTPVPVDELTAELDRHWRRLGLARVTRERLRDDLASDLHAAAAHGLDPRSLLTPDPATFARDTADADGAPLVIPGYTELFLGGLMGAVLGFAFGWPVLSGALEKYAQGRDPQELRTWVRVGGLYGGLALLTLGCTLLAIAVALRRVQRTAATVWRAALTLIAGASLLTPTLILAAKSTDYSTAAGMLLFEFGSCLAVFVAALWSARRWALRGALD